jgi:Tol biopolymer transport system component
VLPVPEEEDNGRAPTLQPPVAATGPTAAVTPTALPPPPPTAIPTATSISTPAPLVGRIAFPVDDGGGHYDVWVVELPDGEPFLVQARARQPSFSKDGRLLVKAQANKLGESIALLDSTYTWLGIINESPDDAYPFWHPDGTRYAYSNANLVLDPATAHLAPYIFTACSLQIPRFEDNIKCQDFRQWGKVVIGEAPVWTDDDRLAYFSYKGDDGIYFVENASVLREAGGLGPQQLLVRGNGRPTDTAGVQVFFSAGDIDGNWEAYAVDLDGSNLINLSNAPLFQDGLPTVSPEGNWVAFVSDRDGKWGIWTVPRTGGEAIKVADLSKINTNPSPWGIGDRAWMTERISWGP